MDRLCASYTGWKALVVDEADHVVLSLSGNVPSNFTVSDVVMWCCWSCRLLEAWGYRGRHLLAYWCSCTSTLTICSRVERLTLEPCSPHSCRFQPPWVPRRCLEHWFWPSSPIWWEVSRTTELDQLLSFTGQATYHWRSGGVTASSLVWWISSSGSALEVSGGNSWGCGSKSALGKWWLESVQPTSIVCYLDHINDDHSRHEMAMANLQSKGILSSIRRHEGRHRKCKHRKFYLVLGRCPRGTVPRTFETCFVFW